MTAGWAWGSLLKSGYMLPEKSIYVQLASYFAAVKNPEQSGLELDVTATVGYWWTWAGIGLRWSRIPGNDYYGIAIQLTKGVSEWFAKDELVEPEAAKPASDPLPPIRIELGGGGAYPVHKGNAGTDGVGVIHLGVYRRSTEKLEGSFTGLGGVLTFLVEDSNGFALGPAATMGGRSGVVGFYARARPFLGARTREDKARFDYGVDGAIGISVGLPEHLDSDDELGSSAEVGAASLGFELTAGWNAGDVFVGGNMQLLLF